MNYQNRKAVLYSIMVFIYVICENKILANKVYANKHPFSGA